MSKFAGASVFAALLALVLVTILASLPPAGPETYALEVAGDEYPHDAAGDALTTQALAGVAPQSTFAWWDQELVIVLKLSRAALEESSRVHDRDTLVDALALPGEPNHVLVAYSAKSTHLGCPVEFQRELGASSEHPDLDGDGSPEGRLLDRCHHAQYDAYNLGLHQPGTPGDGDLWRLALTLNPDGTFSGTR